MDLFKGQESKTKHYENRIKRTKQDYTRVNKEKLFKW